MNMEKLSRNREVLTSEAGTVQWQEQERTLQPSLSSLGLVYFGAGLLTVQEVPLARNLSCHLIPSPGILPLEQWEGHWPCVLGYGPNQSC